ncbi:MAG: class I SAM-dependent methyltransferase [Alphaproteobacteria bacterium]
MSRQDHWSGIYETTEPGRVGWYQERPELSLELIGKAGLAPDAPILDVGSGASHLIDGLLEKGFSDISALDIAEAGLARTRARLGGRADAIDWIVTDVTRWRPRRRYDLWHDRAVYHFLVDAEDRALYVDVLGQALKAGGALVIASFALDGPEKCSGLPVHRHSEEMFEAELGPAFELVESARERHVTPSGGIQNYLYCRFRYLP